MSWTPMAALSFYANLAEYHNRFGRLLSQESDGNMVLTGNCVPISVRQLRERRGDVPGRRQWSTVTLDSIERTVRSPSG